MSKKQFLVIISFILLSVSHQLMADCATQAAVKVDLTITIPGDVGIHGISFKISFAGTAQTPVFMINTEGEDQSLWNGDSDGVGGNDSIKISIGSVLDTNVDGAAGDGYQVTIAKNLQIYTVLLRKKRVSLSPYGTVIGASHANVLHITDLTGSYSITEPYDITYYNSSNNSFTPTSTASFAPSPCNTKPVVTAVTVTPSTIDPYFMDCSTITATDADGDTINTYEWDFDNDGDANFYDFDDDNDTADTESNDNNFAFTYTGYSSDGNYSLKVRVKDVKGAYSDWVPRTFYTNQRPIASFTVSSNSGVEPLSVTIDPGDTSDPDTDQFIVQYQWDWDGDGTIDQNIPTTLDPDPDNWLPVSNSTFDHEYPFGLYNTGLIVMDNLGLLSDADSGITGIQPEKQSITVLSNESINFPRAIGVPRDTNKSPLIDGILSGDDTSTPGADSYGENGWRGAFALSYGDGTTARDVVCNAIKDRSADILYLSFDVDFDTDFEDTDVIILGIRGNSIDPLAAHSVNDRLIKIYPKKPADDQIEVYYLTTGQWLAGSEPANLIFGTREDSGGHNWQIEIQIPMSENGDWKEINNEFLFFYDFYRSYSDPSRVTSHFHFPMEVEDIGDITDLTSYQFDPKFWGKADLTGTGSLNGLSLSSASQIGVQNPADPTGSLTNSMRYDADWETNGNNEVNTFVARVFSDYRQEVLVGGDLWIKMLPVDNVRVHFKFANWGLPSIYPEYWTDVPSNGSGDGYTPYADFDVHPDIVPTAGEYLVDPSSPGSELLMSETQEFSLNWTISDEFIGDIEDAVANTADGLNEAHQCILAEIETLSTSRIVSKSVHRNMDFNAVNDTAFSYPAVISAEGYGIPGTGDPNHQFLLKIFTKEWIVSPEEVLAVNQALESGIISNEFGSIMRSIQQEILARHKGNVASTSAANKGGRETKSTDVTFEQLAQIPYLDEIYHLVKDERKPVSFIEYVIKGFRYTGKKTIINGTEHDLVEPIGSYGHVVRHEGTVEEWDFYIEGAERIDKHTYIITIPPEQTATITDNVKALEPPKYRIHISGGAIIPIDTLADDYKIGPNFILGAGYYFNPLISLHGLFGYNNLLSNVSGIDDTTLMSLSLNARYHKVLSKKISMYAGAGPGIYFDTDMNKEYGVNAGAGVNYRLFRYLELEAGLDYHYMIDSQNQYYHAHGGLLFRF